MKQTVSRYRAQVPGKYAGPERQVRLLFLSDFHSNPDKHFGEWLRRSALSLKPDLILCGGDILTAKGGRCRMKEAAARMIDLAEIAPVDSVDGNHERRIRENGKTYSGAEKAWEKALKKAGVHEINGKSAELKLCGMKIRLSGADLPLLCYSRFGRKKVPDLQKPEGMEKNSGSFQILLAHHPDYFETYRDWGAQLVLSGHVHGGIIRLPLLGGVFGATLRPFPKYTKGLYREGGAAMILGAGLGNHTIPVRINDPEELVLVELTPPA